MTGGRNRFNSYSNYLWKTYGKRVYRVAVDAGFSCPNRGPDRSGDGCTYCDEFGARAAYQQGEGTSFFDRKSIRAQIERGIGFMRGRYDAKDFVLYLQAFSGTWAPADTLRDVYDFCLGLYPFRELVVSTRPDCIDEEKAALLSSYKGKGFDVWIELGLQSGKNSTLRKINRGHTVEDYFRAAEILHGRGIKITTHVIFGLPGEGWREIEKTLRTVISVGGEGIKIHNLHIPTGAPIYREYLLGEIAVLSDQRHLEYVIRGLELLPPAMVVHRVVTDTPAKRLAAPRHFWPKGEFYSKLRDELERRDTWQGRLYKGP